MSQLLLEELMKDRENFPKWRETKPCTGRRGTFGGEYGKNSIHAPKLESEGKNVKTKA